MALTIDEIYDEALLLSKESKILLTERLAESLAADIDGDLERLHLDRAKRRRDELRSGLAVGIDGEEALAGVRRKFNL